MKTTAALNAAAMHGHDAGAGGAGEIAAAAAAAAGGGTAATGFNVVTITINGTKDLLKFGTKPLVQACDIFQLCMRVHASTAQFVTPDFQSYINRKFPLLLITPDFQSEDQPLYPLADRPMRIGPTTEGVLADRVNAVADAVVTRLLNGTAVPLILRATVDFHPVQLDKRRCLVDKNYHPYGSGNCYGTSSDGRYTLSNQYTLPEGNMSSLVVVVVGANHVVTGNTADMQLIHDTKVAINPEALTGSAEFYTAGGHADPQDASIFAYAFAEHCNNLTDGGFCATVGPQQGGAEGALLRLEAYLDTVSGTRPSAGLVHPRAMLFTTGSA